MSIRTEALRDPATGEATSSRPPRPRELRAASGGADPVRLEQILRLQEILLAAGPTDPGELAFRACQSVTALLGLAGSRLLAALDGGEVMAVASCGMEQIALPSTLAATATPALADATNGRHVLAVPLEGLARPMVLELMPAAHWTAERIALARYAAALTAVALRRPAGGVAGALTNEALIALSHDLRQPLNVLLGYTRLLLDDAYGPCPEEQRSVLAAMERNGLELLAMLSGALDLARASREAAAPEAFALRDLLDELCSGSLVGRVQPDVRLVWHVDPEIPAIRSDRFRIRQMLQNLLDNALRYTEHGTVSVAATRHAGALRLTVSDTGPGIGRDDLPGLFEVFRSGGALSARPGGTGCGLYLVQRFAESLGGAVEVESTPGVGTRFTIDLPLDA